MSQEENIKQELIKKFGLAEEKFRIPRPRRIFLEIELKDFMNVFSYAARDLKFIHFATITGLDDLDKFSLIYHLAHDSGIMLNIKTSVSRENPVIQTITPYFPGGEIYERELIDLFGIKVEGLPEGNRYPLTDDWPKDVFPLRKDWKPLTP